MREYVGWAIIAALLLLLATLQWVGARALRSWGVQPARIVVVLRIVNLVAVIGVVVWALYVWVD